MSCLSIENLTICKQGFKNSKLVDSVNIEVKSGEIVALLGSSGSGKSLTCSGIMDVIPRGVDKLSGDVKLNGSLVDMNKIRGRNVSIIMQNPSNAFNPLYSIKTHMKEVLKVKGEKYLDNLAVQSLIDSGIDEPQRVLELYPFQMSGGMLQRTMIALALLSGAEFLLADEPTTDLDLIVQLEILDTLKSLVKKRGMGILIVTHDLGVVGKIADRVVVIDKGIIVERADIENFFQDPKHTISKCLIDAHLSLYKEESLERATINM